jgi:hypothetical protein
MFQSWQMTFIKVQDLQTLSVRFNNCTAASDVPIDTEKQIVSEKRIMIEFYMFAMY